MAPDRIFDETLETSRDSIFQDYLVYYDGPIDNANLCGIGYGAEGGPGQAIVYLRSCSGVPSEAIAAARASAHARRACVHPGRRTHAPTRAATPATRRATSSIPYASAAPLSSLVLDYGHDDYYGHSGNWLDVQDSLWLRHVDGQSRLSVSLQGQER